MSLVNEDKCASGSNMIKPGRTLLKCEPFVYAGYLDLPQRDLHFCDACFTINDKKMRKCKACQGVKYCNETCQEKAWNDGHKYECKRMQLLLRAFDRASWKERKHCIAMARVILRLIVKLQDGNDYYDKLQIGDKVVKRRFADLMSHVEEMQENKVAAVKALVQLPKDLLGPKSKIKIPSDTELIEIYGKVTTNAFDICNGFHSFGYGIFLAGSIFNHSCSPTATRVFEGPTMYVRNVVEISESLPIDQVTITYNTKLLEPSSERRKTLKNYHFYCECERCKSGQHDKDMRGIICFNRSCNAKIDTEELQVPCNVCGHIMDKDLIAKVLETEKFAAWLSDRDNLDLHVIDDCIQRMKSVNFPNSHWLMIKLTRLLQRLYSHPYNIQLFWFLFEMSRLYMLSFGLEKLDEAENCLTEAKSIAETLHGKNSPFILWSQIDHNLEINS